MYVYKVAEKEQKTSSGGTHDIDINHMDGCISLCRSNLRHPKLLSYNNNNNNNNKKTIKKSTLKILNRNCIRQDYHHAFEH